MPAINIICQVVCLLADQSLLFIACLLFPYPCMIPVISRFLTTYSFILCASLVRHLRTHMKTENISVKVFYLGQTLNDLSNNRTPNKRVSKSDAITAEPIFGKWLYFFQIVAVLHKTYWIADLSWEHILIFGTPPPAGNLGNRNHPWEFHLTAHFHSGTPNNTTLPLILLN